MGSCGRFTEYNSGPTIKNLTITDSYIKGGENVGGFIGKMYAGGIEGCTFNGTVEGTKYVGGICGYISRTYSDGGDFPSGYLKNCTTYGIVRCEGDNAGGIAGYILSVQFQI